jgi:non-specific protein-tyrosine kinase
MDLGEYLRLLRRRWRLITVCVLTGLTTAVLATLTATPIYTAKATLFVSAQDAAPDISSAYTGGLFTQQRVKSYVSVIQSPRTAALVRDDLKLNYSPESIAKRIAASAPVDTVLINVSVIDRNPETAQAIANSLGRVFPAEVEEIEKPTAGGPSPVRVSMVQQASLPKHPTSPRPKVNLLLGFLVGLAAGVGGAVLRETLDTSVKGTDQTRELVGAPVLGAINFDPDASKKPLVVVSAPSSSRAEAFRQLRTNLQFVDIEHPLRSVVFTSSLPGEGKSTTTCNLAITLTQAGLRVCLVEGDLRRPRVADYMGVEGAVGLTSVLLGRTSLDDALQPWGDGALLVLASGPLPPNPSELLGSQGMQDLLRELERRVDIVLIDAPPLLPVTDAAVLGTLTSGVVMLVRSNHTKKEQVEDAVATVHAVGGIVLGAVLNMVPMRGPDSYSYGYGYSYKPSAGAHMLANDESPVGVVRRSEVPGAAAPSAASVPAADVLPHLRDARANTPPATPHPVLAELLSQHRDVPPLTDEWSGPPPSTMQADRPFKPKDE